MSLVNDMLNDLEQRKSSADGKPQLDVVPVGREPRAAKNRIWQPLFVVVFIGILAVLTYYFWSQQQQTYSVEESIASVDEQVIIKKNAIKDKVIKKVIINKLMITSQRDDGSFYLSLIADTLDYQIEQVDKTYLRISIEDVSWAPVSLALPDWLSEIHFSGKGFSQDSKGVVISLKTNRPFMYQAQTEMVDDKIKLLVSLKKSDINPAKVKPGKIANVEPARAPATALAEIKKPLVLTSSQLDKRASAEARQLISRGDYQQAEQKLWPVVDGYAASKESRITLATLLLGQQRYGLAEHQLKTGLQHYPQERRLLKLNARLLMAQGHLEAARDSLLKLVMNTSIDSEHVDLLAVIYQRLNDHQQALKLYHQLVMFDAERSSWWVGLGVSMEALGQVDNARAAYLRASRLPVANAAIKQYLSQRLSALAIESDKSQDR